MAACIKVCDKTSGKLSRYALLDVQLTDTVAHVKALMEQKNAGKELSFAVIYCGQRLQEDKPLNSYGIKDGVTLYVLPSPQKHTPEVEKKPSVAEVVSAVQSALSHPAYRNSVEKFLSKPQTVEQLTATIPGLAADPIATAMLQEPELLSILADPKHVPRILASHPCIGLAAIAVAEAIKKEMTAQGSSAGGRSRATARSTFSLDQMSDDEDMPGPARQPIVNVPITGGQLAAALAAATGMPSRPAPQASGSSTSPAPAAPTPPAAATGSDISDFLRQALQAAATPPAPAAAAAPSTTPAVTEANLQSLRDMGITDEAVARRALEATNGNIEAAVDLIFGDGF